MIHAESSLGTEREPLSVGKHMENCQGLQAQSPGEVGAPGPSGETVAGPGPQGPPDPWQWCPLACRLVILTQTQKSHVLGAQFLFLCLTKPYD